MSEEKYRLCVIILLSVFAIGFIAFGYRMSENGRYQQYDQQKDYVILGNQKSSDGQLLLDTRIGRQAQLQKRYFQQ